MSSSLIKEDFINTKHTKNAVYVGSGGVIICILISIVLISTKKYRFNLFTKSTFLGILIFSFILFISGLVYWGQLAYSNEDTKKKSKKSENAGFIAGGILGGIVGAIVYYILNYRVKPSLT